MRASLSALLLFVSILGGCDKPAAQNAAPAVESPLVRGEYLVERVGMCMDCHTPFTPQGVPDMTQHLKGTKLMFAPTVPVPGWKEIAPPIGGLSNGWTKAQLATFLETGKRPNETEAGPPMPRYRFNAEDAAAVAEYLASVK